MTIAMRLAEAMFDERTRKKISQSALSRLSGVPQPTISRILAGEGPREPETATLVKLGRALNVTVDWLREGKEPRKRHHDPGAAREQRQERQAVELSGPPDRSTTTKFQRHWLTNEEAELLAEIRSLTPNSQKRLRTITRSMKRDDGDIDAVDKL